MDDASTASEASTVETTETTTPDAPWYSDVDSQYHETLGKFNDVGSLAKSYQELNSKIGDYQNSIPIPAEDASAEDWASLYTKLGRPKEHTSYEFTAPEGWDVDQDLVDTFAPIFHKAGLNQTQVNDIVATHNEVQQQMAQANQALITEAQTEMAKSFGAPYEQLQTKAENVLDNFKDAEAFKDILGKNPTLTNLLLQVGDMIGEDKLPDQEPTIVESKDEARKEYNTLLQELGQNSNPTDPEVARKKQRMMHLSEVIYG